MTMSLFTVPALANSGANGGWTEGEGYWTNTIDTKYGVFSKPSSHQGWKQKSGKKYRAVGTTHWKINVIIHGHKWFPVFLELYMLTVAEYGVRVLRKQGQVGLKTIQLALFMVLINVVSIEATTLFLW